MSEKFSITIDINSPVTNVWRALVNWELQGTWMALTEVKSSDSGADDSGIGTTIDAFTGIGRLGILDRMRVTAWNPPTFCAVEHYGKVIKGVGEFRLEEVQMPTRAKTRFHWFEEIQGPRPLLLLLKPGILIAVYFSLRKFARMVNAK